MRIWFFREEAGWGAKSLLPNFSPFASLDCDGCCVVGKEIKYQHAQGLLSDSGEQGWLTTLLSLRSSLSLLLLVRTVLPRTHRRAEIVVSLLIFL